LAARRPVGECAHICAVCVAARRVTCTRESCAEERRFQPSLDDRAACGASMLSEACRTFYAEAASAIAAGLLTPHERDVIARVGSRKQNYWRRHLDDLRAVLERRRSRVGRMFGGRIMRPPKPTPTWTSTSTRRRVGSRWASR